MKKRNFSVFVRIRCSLSTTKCHATIRFEIYFYLIGCVAPCLWQKIFFSRNIYIAHFSTASIRIVLFDYPFFYHIFCSAGKKRFSSFSYRLVLLFGMFSSFYLVINGQKFSSLSNTHIFLLHILCCVACGRSKRANARILNEFCRVSVCLCICVHIIFYMNGTRISHPLGGKLLFIIFCIFLCDCGGWGWFIEYIWLRCCNKNKIKARQKIYNNWKSFV